MYNIYLCHHGIKGQRWGVRRYQNEDGTLTSAGQARYNDDGSKKRAKEMSDEELAAANKRLEAENKYKQLTGQAQPGKILNSDTAIKVGMSVVGTAATVALINVLSTNPIAGKELVKKILQSSGLVSVAVLTSSVGGQIRQ